MKCAICGQDCNQALVHLGGYCSPEHKQQLLDKYRAHLKELREEPVLLMPETFTRADFERFTLKLAVHFLHRLSPLMLQRFRKQAPQMLSPLEMSLELKDLILHQLPDTHVSLQNATGLQWFLFAGTYCFKQPVPAQLIKQALVAAHIIDERAFHSPPESGR